MTSSDNSPLSGLNKENCKIIEKKDLYKGFFKMQEYSLQYQKFDGSWSKVLKREIFERGNAAAIIPYDPINDKVVLIEQFRVGAVNASGTPWLIEIVAGMIDKGESEEQAAIREVKEEIGVSLTQKQLVRVTAQYPTPGGASELTTLFIADTDLKDLEKHGGLDTEGEDIRVFKAPLKAAYENVLNGRIHNSVAIIGIQHMMLEKDKVLQAFAK